MTSKGSSPRSAIVTGASGQDGFYLVGRLLAEGTAVHAAVLDPASATDLETLPGAASALTIEALDVTDRRACTDLVARLRPTELYNLAGRTSVAESFNDATRTWEANATAVESLLEAVRRASPETVLYQSSSIDMFGADAGDEVLHDEESPLRPGSPYAVAKAAAHLLCDGYRRAFGLRVACGVLSNHESRRRSGPFLTRRVVDHVLAVRDRRAAGRAPGDPLTLGNLAVRRDWGFAPDYVDGIIRIARQIEARAGPAEYRDYVLATGELHAVWELVDRAFALADLELTWDRGSDDPARWSARLAATGEPAVVVDPALVRASDPAGIGGNPARALAELGWRARPGLDVFLTDMLDADAPAAISS